MASNWGPRECCSPSQARRQQSTQNVPGGVDACERFLVEGCAEAPLEAHQQLHPRQTVETEIPIERAVEGDPHPLTHVWVKVDDDVAHLGQQRLRIDPLLARTAAARGLRTDAHSRVTTAGLGTWTIASIWGAAYAENIHFTNKAASGHGRGRRARGACRFVLGKPHAYHGRLCPPGTHHE